mgnify:CR=1 FL=1
MRNKFIIFAILFIISFYKLDAANFVVGFMGQVWSKRRYHRERKNI